MVSIIIFMTEEQTLFYKKALKASEKLADLLRDEAVVNSILELTDRSRKRRRLEAERRIRMSSDINCVLDEIKAEIEKLDGAYVLRDHVFYAEKDPKDAWFWYVRLKEVIDILDKYKEEESEKEQNNLYNLWMNKIFDHDQINAKTEQWTKEAEKAGMTLPKYLESINPFNNKEGDKE